jgi:hypothetical protein
MLVGMTTQTAHTLIRDAFALTLKLEEATGHFVCTCRPPVNDMIDADVKRASAYWFRQVAVGWAKRKNHGQVDRKDIRVDTNGGFKRGSTMRGTFVAPQLTEEEVAADNTRQQLVAKLKRGEKLVGNEVTLAIGFGLGEPYVSASGELALKPYSYRTSSWTTARSLKAASTSRQHTRHHPRLPGDASSRYRIA